jgi:hypothetical protein
MPVLIGAVAAAAYKDAVYEPPLGRVLRIMAVIR